VPLIQVDSGSVRYITAYWQRFERQTIELKQQIQYRLLGDPEIVGVIGPLTYELQDTLRRLNEEELEITEQVRQLIAWADQIDAATGASSYRPSWLSSGYFGSNALSATVASFSSQAVSVGSREAFQLYNSPLAMISLARVICRPAVNRSTAQATFVNIYRP